ncbi:hypothetical protein ACJX0J_038440, partial [Zea mays]
MEFLMTLFLFGQIYICWDAVHGWHNHLHGLFVWDYNLTMQITCLHSCRLDDCLFQQFLLKHELMETRSLKNRAASMNF